MKYTILLFTLGWLTYCSNNNRQGPPEGYILVEGGKIYYHMSGNGPKTATIFIDGGPGMPSCYSQSALGGLADQRKVVFYDQLGVGRSDRPDKKEHWNIERYADELVRLREELALEEVHLVGISWGTMVLSHYLLHHEPTGVKSVVFIGPLFSTKRWLQDARLNISQLSQSVQDTITKYHQRQEYEAEAYLAASQVYARTYGTRRSPFPSVVCDSLAARYNYEVYQYMWGPTEFEATGTLKKFDILDKLGQIDIPSLVIVGDHDEVSTETAQTYQQLLPNAELSVIRDSGHIIFFDQPERLIQVIDSFLESQE